MDIPGQQPPAQGAAQAMAAAGLMQQLAALEKSDPQEFDRIMTLLEQQAEDAKGAAGSEGKRAPVGSAQLRKKVMEQIRAGQEAAGVGADAVNLPGGKKLGKGGVSDDAKGVEVTPEPGFVIKTYATEDDKTKVFINVCQSDAIAEPSLKTRLDDEGKEVQGTHMPVSVGPPRITLDKHDKEGVVYDVLVNPKVLQEAHDDKTGGYRDVVCQLCLLSVEQKYRCALSRKYKLPKLKYHGDVVKQTVKDMRHLPSIQEVPAGSTSKAKAVPKQPPKVVERLRCIPKVRLCWGPPTVTDGGCNGPEETDGEAKWVDAGDVLEPIISHGPMPTCMQVVFEGAEPLSSASEAPPSLQLSLYTLTLTLPGYSAKEVLLPYPASLSTHDVEAQWCNGEVHLSVTVDQSPWDQQADPGSKPWLLAQALAMEEKDKDDESNEGRVEKDDVALADRFHLSGPPSDIVGGVPSAAAVCAGNEREDIEASELPEDRFHRADFMSQHIIEERDRGRNEKQERWSKEREKAAIKQDPDIEYIDVEDFKPGGKYAPPPAPDAAPLDASDLDGDENADKRREREERARAEEVVRQRTLQGEGEGREQGGGGGEGQAAAPRLSSQLWSQLLD